MNDQHQDIRTWTILLKKLWQISLSADTVFHPMFRLLSWWQGIFSVPGYWMKKLHLVFETTVSQYSQNYSSFATTYKSLWVQQHSLSLGEGGFPWILLVRFSQKNVFKSNRKTLNRNKMTRNIIDCHLNYLSCQGGHKSLCEVCILQNKICIQGLHYRHWRSENFLFTTQNSSANIQ